MGIDSITRTTSTTVTSNPAATASTDPAPKVATCMGPSKFDGPTGTVKQGEATYEVAGGEVSLNGKHIGRCDDSGNYQVTIDGHDFKGNVSALVGATWSGKLSTGTAVDNRPTGQVTVGHDTFDVNHGIVFEAGTKIGTINDQGNYLVTVDGRTYSGALPKDAIYTATLSNGQAVSNAPKVSSPAHERFLAQSGAQLAAQALDFSSARQATSSFDARGQAYETLAFTFDGAPNKAFADAVKSDALAYLAKTPGLQAACDRMISASGVIPARADRLRVDFALNHFESIGAADGRNWGATEAKVKELLSASEVGLAGRVDVQDTAGKTGTPGTTLGYPVGRSTNVFFNVDGTNNTVDYCTNPAPGPSGRGNAVLSGTNNRGQLDLVGTIIIKAGQGNSWQVKDPASRMKPSTELQALEQQQLAAQAKTYDIMLEGNASDWSTRTDAQNTTYFNSRTSTSVTVPASAQGQVHYASSDALDTLAAKLRQGA